MSEESDKTQRQLTPKQERFCQLYTKYWEATRAAREAGYSEKTAGIQGYQLLQIPLVKTRIAEITEAALKDIGISRERVLTEYSYIAFLDPALAYDEIGQLKPVKEMNEGVRRAISKIEVFEVFSAGSGGEDGEPGGRQLTGFTKKVEFGPKKAALDSLGKYLGLFVEKHEHSGPDGKPIEHRELGEITDEKLDAKIAALLSKANQQK